MRPDGSPQNNDPPALVADLYCPSIPARAESLPGLRRVVAQWGRRAGLNEAQVDDLVLGADEAAANAIEHAYEQPGGEMAVLARRREDPARFEVTVTDHGRWQPPPHDPGNGGRGLDMIRQLADHIEIQPSDHGTVVRMTWTITTY